MFQGIEPALAFLGVALAYMLPGLFAVALGRPHHWTILVVNLVLGWTVLGWIGAMVLATKTWSPRKSPAQVPNVEAAPSRVVSDPTALLVPPRLDAYADWLDFGSALSETVVSSPTEKPAVVRDTRRRPAAARRGGNRPDIKKPAPIPMPERAMLSNRQ